MHDNIFDIKTSNNNKFLNQEIFFVSGASGSGKSAIKEELQLILGENWIVYDFDEIEYTVSENINKNPSDDRKSSDKKCRQEKTEKWLQKILSTNKNICLLGQTILGEILACPSAKHILKLGKINYCLLDVCDFERINRLKNVGRGQNNQDTLNFAAWMRMHVQDPQWEQNIITQDYSIILDFQIWNKEVDWSKFANIYTLDTTYLPAAKTACKVADFIFEKSWQNRVIFINGASSSGKTTLSKTLQDKLPYSYIHMAMDTIIAMMPDHINQWTGDKSELGFWWKTDTDISGNPLAYIQMGPFARKIVSLVKETITTALHSGFRVIIDEVCNTKSSYDLWQKILKQFNPIYVGLQANTQVLSIREKKRGDRMIGSARAQNLTIHTDKIYDLMIDTETVSMEKATEIIINQIKSKYYES